MSEDRKPDSEIERREIPLSGLDDGEDWGDEVSQDSALTQVSWIAAISILVAIWVVGRVILRHWGG